MKFQVSYTYSDYMKLQISLAFHILHDIWYILMIMQLSTHHVESAHTYGVSIMQFSNVNITFPGIDNW